METGETPLPTQSADIRNRSVSKQAQQSFPRLRMMPRGVRLLDANASPFCRASSTEEKNGKSGSTKLRHCDAAGFFSLATFFCCSAARDDVTAANKIRTRGATEPSADAL